MAEEKNGIGVGETLFLGAIGVAEVSFFNELRQRYGLLRDAGVTNVVRQDIATSVFGGRGVNVIDAWNVVQKVEEAQQAAVTAQHGAAQAYANALTKWNGLSQGGARTLITEAAGDAFKAAEKWQGKTSALLNKTKEVADETLTAVKRSVASPALKQALTSAEDAKTGLNTLAASGYKLFDTVDNLASIGDEAARKAKELREIADRLTRLDDFAVRGSQASKEYHHLMNAAKGLEKTAVQANKAATSLLKNSQGIFSTMGKLADKVPPSVLNQSDELADVAKGLKAASSFGDEALAVTKEAANAARQVRWDQAGTLGKATIALGKPFSAIGTGLSAVGRVPYVGTALKSTVGRYAGGVFEGVGGLWEIGSEVAMGRPAGEIAATTVGRTAGVGAEVGFAVGGTMAIAALATGPVGWTVGGVAMAAGYIGVPQMVNKLTGRTGDEKFHTMGQLIREPVETGVIKLQNALEGTWVGNSWVGQKLGIGSLKTDEAYKAGKEAAQGAPAAGFTPGATPSAAARQAQQQQQQAEQQQAGFGGGMPGFIMGILALVASVFGLGKQKNGQDTNTDQKNDPKKDTPKDKTEKDTKQTEKEPTKTPEDVARQSGVSLNVTAGDVGTRQSQARNAETTQQKFEEKQEATVAAGH